VGANNLPCSTDDDNSIDYFIDNDGRHQLSIDAKHNDKDYHRISFAGLSDLLDL
jgi:hypothetical protein